MRKKIKCPRSVDGGSRYTRLRRGSDGAATSLFVCQTSEAEAGGFEDLSRWSEGKFCSGRFSNPTWYCGFPTLPSVQCPICCTGSGEVERWRGGEVERWRGGELEIQESK